MQQRRQPTTSKREPKWVERVWSTAAESASIAVAAAPNPVAHPCTTDEEPQ